MTDEASNLLTHYLYQKLKLLERAGKKDLQTPDWQKAAQVYGHHMEKVADIIRNWDIEPGLLMEACFAWARKNRHANGPLPNMLTSQKYLTNALMYHLEIPYEVLQDRKVLDHLMADLDGSFEQTAAAIAGRSADEILTLTSYPLEHRVLMAWNATPRQDLVILHLAPELLARIAGDRRLDLWTRRHRMSYEDLAAYYNQLLPK